MDQHDSVEDTRNVMDEFKGWPHEKIVAALDQRGVELEIAVENTLRDYNLGTIVRTANAFGVRHVHIVGRKQWNKRGAMKTDAYMHIHYHADATAFRKATEGKLIIAIENNVASEPLGQTTFPKNAVVLFGQEGPGISPELLAIADSVVHIEQLGSTRSLNVGVAAGIAMYEWLRQSK